MSNLRRRLQKLEARLTDSSGLVPNSQAWLDYWIPKAARIIDGEEEGQIPLAVFDAILEAGDEQDGATPR